MTLLSDRRPHPVDSVSLAFDEDEVDDVIEAVASQVRVSPRAYLGKLALDNPIGAQVNFQAGPSLELEPTPAGLAKLARFMEKIAPTWTTVWIADCVVLKPVANVGTP